MTETATPLGTIALDIPGSPRGTVSYYPETGRIGVTLPDGSVEWPEDAVARDEDHAAQIAESMYKGRIWAWEWWDADAETATYTVTGDVNDLAGWDVPTFAAAMREAFSAAGLRVEVVERPRQSGGGGYTGDDAGLGDSIKAIADRVSTSAEVSR